MGESKCKRTGEFVWMIPATGSMQVPGVVFGTQEILEDLDGTKALEQVTNVACLPGIVRASFAMPDIHEGYGFPIGGVAAFNFENGVIVPGGIGYDINCGVRLLTSPLKLEDVSEKMEELTDLLFSAIPAGVGKEGEIRLSPKEMNEVLSRGAEWAVSQGFGTEDDLEFCEAFGRLTQADPDAVSEKARSRGKGEIGTLGSGNHFCEIGYVEQIYDSEVAKGFGLEPNMIVFWVHSGSRGLGHQVCSDYLSVMRKAAQKYGTVQKDRQLDSAPIQSEEGKRYFSAMAAAANYAWANRQVLTALLRNAVCGYLNGIHEEDIRLVYDVAHNIGKIEQHMIDGKLRKVLVHRKGATRAFGPGHPEIPEKYRPFGQPVLVPGDMGRASYVLCGTRTGMEYAFGSACHGAGRAMSRRQAKREVSPEELKKELQGKGVFVRSTTVKGLVEEAPWAYKNVDNVVEATSGAGLAKIVARLRPLGVVKG